MCSSRSQSPEKMVPSPAAAETAPEMGHPSKDKASTTRSGTVREVPSSPVRSPPHSPTLKGNHNSSVDQTIMSERNKKSGLQSKTVPKVKSPKSPVYGPKSPFSTPLSPMRTPRPPSNKFKTMESDSRQMGSKATRDTQDSKGSTPEKVLSPSAKTDRQKSRGTGSVPHSPLHSSSRDTETSPPSKSPVKDVKRQGLVTTITSSLRGTNRRRGRGFRRRPGPFRRTSQGGPPMSPARTPLSPSKLANNSGRSSPIITN